MKKIISLILAICLVMALAACGKNKNEELPTEAVFEEETVMDETFEDENKQESEKDENVQEENKAEESTEEASSDKTLGNTLLAFFNEKAEEGMSAEEIANEIAAMEILPFAPVTAPVEEGYLAGFDEEIHDFNTGFTFAPMIGSIPFVGYVFETDDADALIASLKDAANLRWNICVEAEEMVAGKNENKVFFVMCPKAIEE